MKLKIAAIIFLLALGNAFAIRIHVQDTDPTVVKSGGLRVKSYLAGPPEPEMTAEGNGWYYDDIVLQNNASFEVGYYTPANYDPTQPDLSSWRSLGTFSYNQVAEVGSEVWLYNGKFQDFYPGKKVVYILNPWPASAPMVFFGTSTTATLMKTSSDTKRCEWFFYPVVGSDYHVSFKSNIGTQRYGQNGLGPTVTTIDLTEQFKTNDTIFITPTPYPNGAPVIKTSFTPGSGLACSHPVAVIVHDLSAAHPDFEGGAQAMGDQIRTGMVKATLNPATRKPDVGPTPHAGFQTLWNWFTDDINNPTVGSRSYPTCYDLPLTKDKQGYWSYDSYMKEPSKSFFPIDNFKPFPDPYNERTASQYINRVDGTVGTDPTGKTHNFHFCMEMHADFTYEKDQKFNFVGDDDMWVFINNKLALDLGGTHQATTGSINLNNLGLTAGTKYPFDMFYCERQTTGSNLLVQTSIYFEQPSVILEKKVMPDGSIEYHVREIRTGASTCSAPTSTVDTVDAKSTFELSGPGIATPANLPVGPSHGGVININANTFQIVLDTAKPWDLRPGTFTIAVMTESGRSTEIRFTIPGSYATEFANKREAAPAYTGDVSAISIIATLNGGIDARSDTVKLTIPAGLSVFADSAMTQAIAGGADIVIPATGTIRVYATSQTPGTYPIVLLDAATGKTQDNESFTFVKRNKVSVAAAPGTSVFPAPMTVTLTANPGNATIYYTLDGSDPTVSPTRLTYAAPIPLAATTTLKAYGVATGLIDSDVLTAVYTYKPPVNVSSAWYKDTDGDGRIDKAYVVFDKALTAVPAKLAFTIVDQVGRTGTVTAAGAAIAFDGGGTTRLAVTLAPPFDYEITSVAAGSKGHTFAGGDLLDKDFAVADSVPPVIFKAEVFESDETHADKRIVITFSEPVTAPASSLTAFVFKRGDAAWAPADVKVLGIAASGNNEYTIRVDSTGRSPIPGDSVAIGIGGEVKDTPMGNAPATLLFHRIEGTPPKAKPTQVTVTFYNGATKDAPKTAGPEPTTGPAVLFIPIGVNGQPLAGAANGKCGTCPAGDNATGFVGPILRLEIPGPVDYEFQIFNNFGEFVAKGKGKVEESDLAALESVNGKYISRIVWTGYTSKGSKAGTGVYILQATLKTALDPNTGAPPATRVKRVVFGLLRQLRG
jgi:fibro-slime domain-containing protein